MKLIFLFIIVSFSFLKAANSVDLFYALKEKNKIEYISKITRLYLNSVSNPYIDEKNILTVRNSSIDKLILNNLQIDKTELLIIKDMEKISNDLINNNISINCISIVDSALNVNGITYSICFELDRKYRAIYNVGPYYRQSYSYNYGSYDVSEMVNISELNTSIGFFSKIKNDIKDDIILEEKIRYMTISSLQNLCNKITNNDNKSFIPKYNLTRAIVTRANILNNPLAVSPCYTYNYKPNHNYVDYFGNVPIPTGGVIASLMGQISILQAQILALDTQITTAESNYNTIYADWFSTPPGLLKTIKGVAKDDAYNLWQDYLDQKTRKLNIISLLQTEIINLGGTP